MSEPDVNLKDLEFTIVNALSLNYSSAYYIDFDQNKIYPYRMNEFVDKHYGDFFRSHPTFQEAMANYIMKNTAIDDKEEMLAVTDYENLKRELTVNKVFTYDYRVIRDGKPMYFRMKITNITEGEGLHKAVIGFADISTQKINDIERYAYISDVTGGNNYNFFKEEMNSCTEGGYLTTMDIYAFKIVNSTCGIKTGDKVLKASWNCILDCIGKDDLAAHINADHFVMFFKDSDKECVDRKVAHITEALEKMSKDMEVPLLSPYFGSAKWDPNDPVEQIYGNATFAKHSIKGNNNTNHAYYSKADSEKILQTKQMSDAFESAIANHEFELWYQPKYTPVGKVLIGAEALVRWRRDGKLISPGLFIPVFEKNGMIKKLDEYVFRTVCLQQRKWKDEGKSIIPVSVNISRVSLYFQNVVEQYSSIIEATGIESKFVPLEITETAAIDNTDIRELTEKFYNSGFVIHMDDFGTGYSSLSSLNQMHFNTLKLDKSIIDYIGNYGGDKLLEHTITLAKELGLHVTAEGVETESQVSFLKGLNCDSIQGYFFSKPLPVEEFTEKLSTGSPVYAEDWEIDNDLSICSVNEILDDVVGAVSEYARCVNKAFIYNPTLLTEKVYCSKDIVADVLRSLCCFVTDIVPENECCALLSSRAGYIDGQIIKYKFVISGINSGLTSYRLDKLLSEDEKVAHKYEKIVELGGSVTAVTQEDNNVLIVVRLPLRPAG